ncbi:hypothetical protein [Brasilonema bromeliae]
MGYALQNGACKSIKPEAYRTPVLGDTRKGRKQAYGRPKQHRLRDTQLH